MKNYFIKPYNTTILQFLKEKGLEIQLHERIRSAEITSRLTQDQKREILKECDSKKLTMYGGKPQANFGNAIIQFF